VTGFSFVVTRRRSLAACVVAVLLSIHVHVTAFAQAPTPAVESGPRQRAWVVPASSLPYLPRQGESEAAVRLGTLVVEVRSAADGQPIAGAVIGVAGRVARSRTDELGRGSLRLAAGIYALSVRALGYAPARLPGIVVTDGESRVLAVSLSPAPVALDEVVVTAGTYGILGEEAAAPGVVLTRAEAETAPHMGEDIYRAVNRLPGVSSGDIGAKLEVRGSPSDQLLVQLDGLELHEPFHLKDVEGGVFSIIDVDNVGGVDLVAGGFGAEHGDRMGGVFSMRTLTPERSSTAVGASVTNLSFHSQGLFASGRGAWLAGARRGFLDVLLKLMEEDEPISPTYFDVFAKVQYQVADGHLVSAHLLYAGDRLSATEEDDTEIDSDWSSSYAWLNWDATFGSALSARTVLSAGRVSRSRDARDYGGSGQILDIRDRGDVEVLGLKQDWSLRAASRWLVRWGLDLRRGRATYDYRIWRRDPELAGDTLAPRPDGHEIGLYVANRLRPVGPLTLEVGLRYDRQSHTGEDVLAPRVNLALDVAPRTTLRGAWGMYHQSQGMGDLQVADLDTTFYRAQRSEHRVLGIDHRLEGGTTLRVEAYQRLIAHPRPEYRSLVPIVELVPEEGPGDRVRVAPTRGRASGVEFLVRRDAGDRFAWSASYALASAEDEVGGRWVPRPHDQRHTVRGELAYRPNPRWSVTWAWQFHSAWPTTEHGLRGIAIPGGGWSIVDTWGPLNGSRLPAYHRMDTRVTRHFPVGRGRLSVYLDVFNAYNHRNPFAYVLQMDGMTANGVQFHREVKDQVGVLPTLGARWEF
jgi:outer membrane receptor protein involved in Fe transport